MAGYAPDVVNAAAGYLLDDALPPIPGASITKQALAQQAFAKFASDPNRTEIVKALWDDNWLGSLVAAGRIVFDGTNVSRPQ